MIEESYLYMYTDGSSKKNPRRGGIGLVFVTVNKEGQEIPEDTFPFPGYKNASNNEMELRAVIVGLKEVINRKDLYRFERIIICTDSMYVKNFYRSALGSWPKNNWLNNYNRPVENVELWIDLRKQLTKLYDFGLSYEFQWVKAHHKNEFNKMADKLAKDSADNPLNEPLVVETVRKKVLPGTTRVGSIDIKGQQMNIYVQTTEKLAKKRGYRHKYCLWSENSKSGDLDIIFSKELVVIAGHYYNVQVNDDKRNPWILDVVYEFNHKTGEQIENKLLPFKKNGRN